jgi:hypothetical protein
MRFAPRFVHALAFGLLLAVPAISEAGAPLICHPFDPGNAQVLQWGSGPGWNTPDGRYDVRRLVGDTMRLLGPNVPVIARMENLRRATIYAVQDARVAQELLTALVSRASSSAEAHAIFDAGYLIESYKQAAHQLRGPAPTADGYAMVIRAIGMTTGNGEMEFAASLMKSGAISAEHRRRAKASAAPGSLLARNLVEIQ